MLTGSVTRGQPSSRLVLISTRHDKTTHASATATPPLSKETRPRSHPIHRRGAQSLSFWGNSKQNQQSPGEASAREAERARDRVGGWPAGRPQMMAAMWWWAPLPAWLSSSALWFLVVNAVVAAVAVLSRARPPLPSPRRGSGVTRRASSAVLHRLRSFSIFSFPSACFNTTPLPHPDAASAAQETEESPRTPTTTAKPSPRALPLPPSPLSSSGRVPAVDADEPTGMSMDEAYALVLEARRQPDREREEEARRSEVDAKAEEFIRGFKEDLRQQRLNSIFNYTQMLKQRAFGAGASARRQPHARPDQL